MSEYEPIFVPTSAYIFNYSPTFHPGNFQTNHCVQKSKITNVKFVALYPEIFDGDNVGALDKERQNILLKPPVSISYR